MDQQDLRPARLAPLLEHPESAGVITDFDGTLAPIVDDPEQARPLPDAPAVLHRLAHRFGRVAVVSGRPVAFLAEHLRTDECGEGSGCEGLVLAGLYGLERVEGADVVTDPEVEKWRSVVSELVELAEEQAPPGVIVETKGLSLTLHYRTAPEQRDWARRWVGEQGERTGLASHGGRMSEELRPPIDVDKGSVVRDLAEGLRAVCFLGDDVGDLPAFAALDRLAEEAGVSTLKVVVRSEEATDELLGQADVTVDRPEGALELLNRLL
ncbi:MAG: trehalose-phosphatase [Actinomycetota bacterium]|nr:trehalose-phosphatase [Actinomycetota bacterium]